MLSDWGFTAEPEEPWDDLSLAEEAALHAPEPWTHPATGDTRSALPADFPVQDPFQDTKEAAHLLGYLRSQHCAKQDCVLDDPRRLAEGIASLVVDGCSTLQACATALWAHGEEMLAEEIVRRLDSLAMDLLKPYLVRQGLVVDGYDLEDDE